MKRRLLKLGLLLMLGAIINVAVAWVCISRDSNPELDRGVSNAAIEALEAQLAYPEWTRAEGFCTRVRSFGYIYESVSGDQGQEAPAADEPGAIPQPHSVIAGPPPLSLWRASCGWPMPSLRTEGRFSMFVGYARPEVFHQFKTPQILRIVGSRKYLPYGLIPSGFAINTIVYAAMVWLLFFAPFKLRRWRRIKRGLCPACAYPVGTSDKCTECGKAVTPRRGAGM